MFCRQIGRKMEIYVDDMLVKSKRAELHLDNLRETFNTLRKYQMRLNPAKCVFGVSSGKFLAFMVSQRGTNANHEKVKAILDMTSSRSVKEVQRLTGCIASLNKFMSKATEKCLPFFKTLKKAFQCFPSLNKFMSKATEKCLPFFKTLKKAFQWTDECEAAFQALKD